MSYVSIGLESAAAPPYDAISPPPEEMLVQGYLGHRYGLRFGRLAVGIGPRISDEVTEPGPMPEARLHTLFTPDTIQHPRMPEGGRHLADYERNLLFHRNELSGLTVLDLGTGPRVRFARGLAASGIAATVISVSPDFIYDDHRQTAQSLYDGPLVAATAEALPFRNESFDRVFALFVADHAHDQIAMYRELARVLRRGGEAKVGPYTPGDISPQWLSDRVSGVQITLETIPPENSPPRRLYDPGSGMAMGEAQPIVVALRKEPHNSEMKGSVTH